MSRREFWLTLLAFFVAPGFACACPVCNSATGVQVRKGLFDGDFGHQMLVTALPFPVFAGIVVMIHFGPVFPRQNQRRPSVANAPAAPKENK